MSNAPLVKHSAICMLVVLPVLYVWVKWSSMPAVTPLHYNLKGAADRYGGKQKFLLAILILTVVNLLTYLLMVNIHRIDPKRVIATKSQM